MQALLYSVTITGFWKQAKKIPGVLSWHTWERNVQTTDRCAQTHM